MILYRSVLQAKFGKADDLVAAIKQGLAALPAEQVQAMQPRILTDISGPFDTVVLETTHESLAAYEQFRKAALARASGEQSPAAAFIASGRNEYYTIEM